MSDAERVRISVEVVRKGEDSDENRGVLVECELEIRIQHDEDLNSRQ